ncbi:hypothetical protein QFC20_003456 [Naganishia adeliensis]|uniref:Uncharacterized protein n=1 Tax=Naganishia adeliensis TaxID=92952 RepID=A0ACC2WBP9_9TREE|nr:hypothetical protein QFC20_003456 [Naganishia adeliensis]
MLFNALSTVALLLSTISGTDALRTGRHHRGLESRHAAHVPANKRTFTFAANATAGEHDRQASNLGRAYPNSRATFYAIGLGACGQYNHEPDFVVALNSAQYGGGYPGPECFKYITITGGPKNGHAVAQIVDECPTCPYGGLDMSISLFEQFATQDDGVASITWWYNDGSDAPAPTTQAPAPTTKETPTSTWVAPTTTSTTPAYTPSSSTYEAPPSTSSTPTSTWQAPTTSSSVWVAPTTSSTSTWQAPSSSSSSSSSTWSSSSSVWTSSSSSAPASSSSASSSVGRVSAATVTNLVATSTRVSTASTSVSTAAPATTSSLSDDDGESNDDSSVSVTENSNLDLLSTYTAQLGSLVVVAAQMVIA